MTGKNTVSLSKADKANDNKSVTVKAKRHIKPEYVNAFKSALDEVTEAVRSFPGFLEVGVMRPSETAEGNVSEWGLVMHFDSEANLKDWENSPERKRWITLADSCSIAAPEVERVNGLEAWFGLPNRKTAPPPPKWKTAITSAVAIYPMLLLMPRILAPVIEGLPILLANLVGVLVMMPLMTWCVMPLVTWLFKWWLYPHESNEVEQR